MNNTDKKLCTEKIELLRYFRDRTSESLEEIRRNISNSDFKQQASAVNKAVIETKDNLIKTVLQEATKEKWDNKEILESILMITYTSYIVMIETRNEVWPYEYMTFSRRIGELWDPFCNLCFQYPLKNISLFVPPLFSDVKKKLTCEIETYIDKLSITNKQKGDLKKYYDKVWSLVTSGEIKLELDLHFKKDNIKYIVDFKSGFGSNEKGNTNRLLLVATIYKNLEENYKCVILVRSEEDRNNNYFQTLKKSGIWEAYCGNEAYKKIKEYSGFNIKQWITRNVNWKRDLRKETITHFKKNKLDQYLIW